MKPVAILLTSIVLAVSATSAAAHSRAELRQFIIAASIDNYRINKGPCACPYSLNRAGNICGVNSAYSKAGVDKPRCYTRDISDAMLNRIMDAAEAGR